MLFYYKTQKQCRTEKHRPANLLTFSLCKPQKSLGLLLGHVNGGITHHYTKPGFFIPLLPFRRYKDFPPKGFKELSFWGASNFEYCNLLLVFLLSR